MNKMRNLLLISSSRVYGYNYLETAEEEIKDFLNSKGIKSVLFIPYASKNYDDYLNLVGPAFEKMGFNVEGVHIHKNPVEAVRKARAIFVGGGNTFLLLKTLCDNNLIDAIRNAVLENDVLYIGSSAGTNVATRSIHTTNDMPIVYPPTFDALNLVPFNINPHYLQPDAKTKHMGETRDQRIGEYLETEGSGPVLGLREGGMLRVTGDSAILKGIMGAKLFVPGNEPKEYDVGSDLSFLLKK